MKATLLTILLLTGCAFSKSNETPPVIQGQQVVLLQNHIQVDWVMSKDDRPDPKLKAIRNLGTTGAGYQSDTPVTLPAGVPAVLVVRAQINSQDVPAQVDFIRGSIVLSENKIVRVPVELTGTDTDGILARLTFQITGLNAALKSDLSSQGTLKLELFNRSSKMSAISIEIRTPPSRIANQALSISEWTAARSETGVSEFIQPLISGVYFNLLQVVRFSNEEPIGIRLQTPRKPTAQFFQRIETIQLTSAECSHTLPRSVGSENLSTTIYYIPLDERMVAEMDFLTKNPDASGFITSTLQPGEAIEVGVYAVGPSADDWMSFGPRGSSLSSVSAPSHCDQRCTGWECEPGGRPSALSCRCLGYANVPRYTNVLVGTERKETYLTVNAPDHFMRTQYSDLDPIKDGEFRSVQMLSSSSLINRR